jgi:hypothetical protein
MPETTKHVYLDLEEISAWIGGVKNLMGKLDQSTVVSTQRWEPTPAVNVAPIALPLCIRPPSGKDADPTTTADLVETLEYLRAWTAALSKVI